MTSSDANANAAAVGNDGDDDVEMTETTAREEIQEEEEEEEDETKKTKKKTKKKKEIELVQRPRTHELEETLICNGRYQTEREINRGSSAVVIKGYDVTNKLPVALKIMDVSQTSELSLPLNSITREVKYAHKLNSPSSSSESSNTTDNFARLLNVTNHISPETKREYVVLVWELLEGLDLLDYINSKGGRLTNEESRALFAQLLNAVETIHERGFAHRDLKPDNCLVVDTKQKKTLKVIDFGLSKGLDSAKTLGIGTPDYMAPELIGAPSRMKNGGGYDPIKIDVFAMGVTLYLMLLGRYPFEDPTNHSTLSTMKNIRAGNFARPQKGVIDSDALNLIENMLAPDPEKRFSLKDIRNHTWVQREREQEILLQEYDEFEKRLQDVRRQKEREEEAKRQREQEISLKRFKEYEKRLIQAQKMKEARRERDENAPNTLLGLRLRLVESKIDRKQEIPKEKKKKPAAFGIASLFGGGRKK